MDPDPECSGIPCSYVLIWEQRTSSKRVVPDLTAKNTIQGRASWQGMAWRAWRASWNKKQGMEWIYSPFYYSF